MSLRAISAQRHRRFGGWLLSLMALLALLAAPLPGPTALAPDTHAMAADHMAMDGPPSDDCCDSADHATAGPHCAACLMSLAADSAAVALAPPSRQRHAALGAVAPPAAGPEVPPKPPRLA